MRILEWRATVFPGPIPRQQAESELFRFCIDLENGKWTLGISDENNEHRDHDPYNTEQEAKDAADVFVKRYEQAVLVWKTYKHVRFCRVSKKLSFQVFYSPTWGEWFLWIFYDSFVPKVSKYLMEGSAYLAARTFLERHTIEMDGEVFEQDQNEADRLKEYIEKGVGIEEGFPVGLLSKEKSYLPWAYINQFEAQAQKNHGQSLRGLASRGGCSPCETLAIIQGQSWSNRIERSEDLAVVIISCLVEEWEGE